VSTVRDSGDPQTGSVAYFGIVGVLVTVLVIIGLWAIYLRATGAEAQDKVYAQQWSELARLRSDQQIELERYRWISEQDGIVEIPIDRAMELVISELSAGGSE